MSEVLIEEDAGEVISPPANLRHWDLLSTTDPKHTKPFQRPGGFRGTAIRPIWNHYRLTEHFGPHGVGWGTDEPHFQVIEAGGEILVFCTLRCWYMDNDSKRAEIYGVGGDKVLARFKEGPRTDDEAFKKAFTDALGNAFQRVGVSADVHMGLFENTKYVEEARKQFSPQASADRNGSARPPAATRANPAVALTDERQDEQRRIAKQIKYALDAAKSGDELREVYDDVLAEWGEQYKDDAALLNTVTLNFLISHSHSRLQQIGDA